MRGVFKKILLIGAITGSMLLPKNEYQIQDSNKNLENTITAEIKRNELVIDASRKNVGVDFYTFFRYVYTDKDSRTCPDSYRELEPKTKQDIKLGRALKDSLQIIYESMIPNHKKEDNWGPMLKSEMRIPNGTYTPWHQALDIFSKNGTKVIAPFSGLVISSGDMWRGEYNNNKITNWNGKGLTIRGGNGVIIYNPEERGYMLITHLDENIKVQAGDFISKGSTIGRIGPTGTASRLGHDNHIHVAYKLPTEDNLLKP